MWIGVTKTWQSSIAFSSDNLAKIFPHVQLYILSALAKILVELPSMHPFTMTTRAGMRHMLST